MKTNFGLLATWASGAVIFTLMGGPVSRGQTVESPSAAVPAISKSGAPATLGRGAGLAGAGTAAAVSANRYVRPNEFPKLPNTFNWDGEGKMNAYFVQQFIDSANFGNLRMIPRTMMIDDAMRLTRQDPNDVDSAGQPARYKLDNLELIGVIKHPTPVAFVVNRHERNGRNFGSVTTRQLTAFEVKSLDQLRAGAEAVVEQDKDGCVIVGPVRARESCIECHSSAKVGDVLGAFSYKLTRMEKENFNNVEVEPPLPTAAASRQSEGVDLVALVASVKSEPAALDGLELVIQPSRDIIPTSEPLALRVTFRNLTDQPMRLPNNTAMFGDWLLKLEDVQSGKVYTAGYSFDGNQTTTAAPSAIIKPGGTFETTAAYTAGSRVFEGDLDFTAFQKAAPRMPTAVGANREARPLPFKPGEYKIRLDVRFPNAVTEDSNPAAVWKHQEIVSNAVPVKIGPVPVEKTGSISGVVLDRHGRPAANATLTSKIALPYTLSPPVPNSGYGRGVANRPTPPAERRTYTGGFSYSGTPVAKTNTQGAFVISNLPTGTYLVEAELNDGDPMHWAQNAPMDAVEVKEGVQTKMAEPLRLDYNRSDF